MALTATATSILREHILQVLHMVDPVVIESSPEKENLYFSLCEFKSIKESLLPLMMELKANQTKTKKTIVFCHRPIDCSSVWIEFCNYLGEEITEPPGHTLKIAELRLVDCYTGCCTEPHICEVILNNFTISSCLRVLIATVAFGLGINCPDIRRVIHFGIPVDVEMYVQQVGRAGRDCISSRCMMFVGKGVYKRFCDKQILQYCSNKDECRRSFLYSRFLSYKQDKSIYHTCMCCDICSLYCNCDLHS